MPEATEVDFAIGEHPPAITAARERHYERIRARLERLSGVTVRGRCYTDVSRLRGAGLILSGSFEPWERHDRAALRRFDRAVAAFDGPVLGICAGMQLQTMFAGGTIATREHPELGFAEIVVLDDGDLLHGLHSPAIVYKHHAVEVVDLPGDFLVLACSRTCRIEAIAAPARRWWGTQFHPERFSARFPSGERVLRNFFAEVDMCSGGRLDGLHADVLWSECQPTVDRRSTRSTMGIAVEATGRVDARACACRSLVSEGISESDGNHFKPGVLPLFELYLNSINLRIARDNVHATSSPQKYSRRCSVSSTPSTSGSTSSNPRHSTESAAGPAAPACSVQVSNARCR